MAWDFEELTKYADRMTYHRAKAEAMGFKFVDVRVFEGRSPTQITMRGEFRCVCGRREYFEFNINAMYPEDPHIQKYVRSQLDPANELTRFGSFSSEHLRMDGYTSEQIEDIETKGRTFDEECLREIENEAIRTGKYQSKTASWMMSDARMRGW